MTALHFVYLGKIFHNKLLHNTLNNSEKIFIVTIVLLILWKSFRVPSSMVICIEWPFYSLSFLHVYETFRTSNTQRINCRPQTKLREGNVFTSVCYSVQRRVCLPTMTWGRQTLSISRPTPYLWYGQQAGSTCWILGWTELELSF